MKDVCVCEQFFPNSFCCPQTYVLFVTHHHGHTDTISTRTIGHTWGRWMGTPVHFRTCRNICGNTGSPIGLMPMSSTCTLGFTLVNVHCLPGMYACPRCIHTHSHWANVQMFKCSCSSIRIMLPHCWLLHYQVLRVRASQ